MPRTRRAPQAACETRHHDPVLLTAYLHRTPAAYRLHLRTHSLTQLEHLQERGADLPDEYRDALSVEVRYRQGRPWMRDAPGAA